jgi:hypothetical protein
VALSNIQSSPRLALEPYSRLRNIVQSLKDAQPAAEGAAPHLVDYVEKLASGLRKQMMESFSKRLQKTLEQMGWPSKDFRLPEDLRTQWIENVELLLNLQTPELTRRDIDVKQQNAEPQILLPLEVMVHPLDLRFKYHFSGDKPTNRLDKV